METMNRLHPRNELVATTSCEVNTRKRTFEKTTWGSKINLSSYCSDILFSYFAQPYAMHWTIFSTLFQTLGASEKKLTASLKTLKQTLRKSGNSMSVRDLYEHFKRGKVFKKNNRKENFHQWVLIKCPYYLQNILAMFYLLCYTSIYFRWSALPELFLLTAKLLMSKSEPVMASDILNSAIKVLPLYALT